VKHFLEQDKGEEREVFVILKCGRETTVKLAHEGCGQMGTKRVLTLVQRCFTWPSCAKIVAQFCRSCSVCQRVIKSGGKKAPIVERPVLTEPFESMAFDLFGPIPKARGGYR